MIVKKVLRRVRRAAGLAPRASDTVTGFFNRNDIRSIAAMPVLTDPDPQALRNPSKKIQETFVGASFDDAFTEAAKFLNQLFELEYPKGVPADLTGTRILDFGCGWGRLLRLLSQKQELATASLYGCDPLADAVKLCRRSLPRVAVSHTNIAPPTDFRSDLFDIVYACSVFSHLSEKYNLSWAQEFQRIVKPGGVVFVSTQGRSFLEICRQHREASGGKKTLWHENLAKSFTDPDIGPRYDAGELLYAPGIGGSALVQEAYGEAMVPRQFFETQWARFGFDLVDWWEHPQVGGQNNAFLRKRLTRPLHGNPPEARG